MQRPYPLVAVLLAAAVAILLPVPAQAVTIHRHALVDRMGDFQRPVEVVYSIPPPDRDDDGYANSKDGCPREHYTGHGGCKPQPEPQLASPSQDSAAAAPAYATVDTSQAGAAPAVTQCESGGDYTKNTGNGYYGAYQFDPGTWDAYGDSAYAEASDAPPSVQDAAAASVPYDAWPNC